MEKPSFFGPYEKYVIAFIPFFGVGLTSINQIGRMKFYGVPYELMEFSAVNTVMSAIALIVTSSAGLLSIAIVYTRDLEKPLERISHQLVIAIMLTGPFWVKSIDLRANISWATVIFIAMITGAGFMTEGYYRAIKTGADSTRELQKRIEKALHVALVIGFLVFVGAFAHGYFYAKETPTRLFVKGTNYLVAGSFNGRLILKKYDPSSARLDKLNTTLLEAKGTLELDERNLLIRDQ